MPPYLDLKGASGASYRYHLADPTRPITPGSGIFLLVSQRPDGLIVLAAEEALNLQQEAPLKFERAGGEAGQIGLYLRLHVARNPRQAELADLRAALSLAS